MIQSVAVLLGRNRDDRWAKDTFANLPTLAMFFKYLSLRLAAPQHLGNRFVFSRIKWLPNGLIRSRRLALHHGEELAMDRGDAFDPRLALQTLRE